MQISAAPLARNGNPGIVPPHLVKPLPEPSATPSPSAKPVEPSSASVRGFNGIVIRIPRHIAEQLGGASARPNFAKEQAAAEDTVRGAQDFFAQYGVGANDGNDSRFDVFVEPRFKNAGYISKDDALSAGMRAKNDLMVVGRSPETGSSYAFDEDVIRHEYAHRIVDKKLGLGHKGESGTMHESLADTFAAAMDDDWVIGEKSTPGGMRDMMNPERFGDPGHADDFVRTRQDKGGVHINNGIPNKAAALIGEQLGRPAMAQIYLDAMDKYMSSSSGIVDTAKATMLAAADRYGSRSTEVRAVADAWDSVGVLSLLKQSARS